MQNQKTIFITGGAGYIGAMLAENFAKRDDVSKVICLDKEEESGLTLDLEKKYRDKIIYIQDNLINNTWQEKVRVHSPNIVVHTAWQIRSVYENKELSYKWNIIGSQNLFDFAFEQDSDGYKVDRLIYFSTIASYGAYALNTIDHFFTENENFRISHYHYAEEKRLVENNLKNTYFKNKKALQLEAENKFAKSNKKLPQISIIRPASITGPRRRGEKLNFNLQSALSGSLKGGIYSLISVLTSVMPVTDKWLRQYIHEDDINDIALLLSLDEGINHDYEAFNACPPGAVVLKEDMARVLGKRLIVLHPQIVRFVFFVFWHLTRGSIPTSPGSWRGYAYPIAVDGSKITEMYDYIYKFETLEAFTTSKGRYGL
jgi:nucleoside-diphosphate-sugar epimerase